MKFLIVTLAPTLKKEDGYYSYGPYVNEMNIWSKYTDDIRFVSPITYPKELLVSKFSFIPSEIYAIPNISLSSLRAFIKTIISIPIIVLKMYKGMLWSDHIHIRCPGNVGLLACIIQIFFPKKIKTVKYAGNWDPNSKQPFSYKLQKWIVSNTFLSKNIKVLVYGNWKNQTKNIKPFFTATYYKSDINIIDEKPLTSQINFIYVGTFSKGKQPLLSVKTVQKLYNIGYDVKLDMYGDGDEFSEIKKYIKNNDLTQIITLHGNVAKEVVKESFQKAHFLLFISKSEGWPKVVAEAMFWRCLPITTAVSCVPDMLANGNRGGIVKDELSDIMEKILFYLSNNTTYHLQAKKAMEWSHDYTLDKFESEIKLLLKR